MSTTKATPEELEKAAQDERAKGPNSPCSQCKSRSTACRCILWQTWFANRWHRIQTAAGLPRPIQEGENNG